MPPRIRAAAHEPGEPLVRFAALHARVCETVERVAGRDPNPLDPYRGLFVSDRQARTLVAEHVAPAVDPAFGRVAACLELDALDAEILALCCAPDLSPHYGRLFGYLHDDVSRRLATPALVARLLDSEPEAVLERFAATARLRATHAVALLDPPGLVGLLERPVKVADRIVSEVVGVRLDRPAWETRARRVALGPYAPATDEARRALGGRPRTPVLVAGPDAELAAAVGTGRPLLVLGLTEALEPETRAAATLAAALEGRVLCVDGLEDHDTDELARVLPDILREVSLFLTTDVRTAALERWFAVRVEVPAPTTAERAEAWRRATGRDDVTDVAAAFRLSLRQIDEAAHEARPDEPLEVAARRVSGLRLGDLARRLKAPYGWDDLVLPDREHRLLRSVSGYLRHRDLVLGTWGYNRAIAPSQGLKVLFAGDSGTGKTMAAQVLAHDLGLEIYAIDLATIVSKYIGETEKNLRRVFAAAERSSAILFFDEADALFGRRSEVRDSHDRHANLETAYLLQLMEGHPGAVILATNLRQNIDHAFLRRLDFLIEFPVPEEEHRERIWRRVLPAEAPLGDDVDLEFLARQFSLSGGGIRNASLAAAFMAADDGRPIEMTHLVRGVALEYDKLGRLTLESEFERFHALVRH